MVQWPWVTHTFSLGCPPYLLQVSWWPQTYRCAKTWIQLWNKRGKIYLNYLCFRWYSDPEWHTLSSLGCHPYLLKVSWWPQTYPYAKALIQLRNKRGNNNISIIYGSDGTVTLSGHAFFSRVSFISSSSVLVTANIPLCQKPWSSYGIKGQQYISIICFIWYSDPEWTQTLIQLGNKRGKLHLNYPYFKYMNVYDETIVKLEV